MSAVTLYLGLPLLLALLARGVAGVAFGLFLGLERFLASDFFQPQLFLQLGFEPELLLPCGLVGGSFRGRLRFFDLAFALSLGLADPARLDNRAALGFLFENGGIVGVGPGAEFFQLNFSCIRCFRLAVLKVVSVERRHLFR